MKIKTKFFKKQLEKYKIIILLIPILFILSLTYTTSRSFLAEGQEDSNVDQDFQIYENLTQDKINLFCGDIDGDEVDEIITINSEKDPSFKVFNLRGEQKDIIKGFSGSNKNEFSYVAGDIDGDKKDEIIRFFTENSSLIEILKDNKIISKFEVFKNLNIGTSVALGDINNDGLDEIVVGAGRGGGPQVDVFNGQGERLASFFVFSPSLRNGVNVVTGNVDEEAKEEIIVSQKRGGEGVIRIYKLDNIKTFLNTFMAYPNTFKDGANLIASDLDNNGRLEIITTRDIDDNNQLEMKLFNSTGNKRDLTNDKFSKITYDSKISACDFQDRKGIVVSYQDDERVKVEVIYNY